MTDTPPSHTASIASSGWRRGFVLVVVAVLVVTSMIGSAGATPTTRSSSQVPSQPAFVVDLDADGSARMTLAITFNLTTDSERDAFEALRSNETAQADRTQRFATRMRAIAARAANETGREMDVTSPDMTFTTQNETGIVALSVTWNGLAAQEGDRLVVQEPFTGGFDLDRQFRVVGPEGYELTSVSPSPAVQDRQSATWSTGTSLDNFSVTFAPSSEGGETEIGLPGFGIGVALVALLAAAALLVTRRRAS